MFGLAFKAGTDDVRETPAIYLVRELLGRQAKVHLYDPVAIPNFQQMVKESQNVRYFSHAAETAKGVDAIILLTPWDEFMTLDYDNIRSNMQDNHFLMHAIQ